MEILLIVDLIYKLDQRMIGEIDMNEHTQNPFDPSWYRDVFDEYDDIDTINKKIEAMLQGLYKFPDADGSRSSELYKHYMTSNSFVPHAIRDTLKEIYSNSTYKLKASNHDEVQFRYWQFHFDDIRYISNSNQCEISLTGPNVIHPENRDKYKLSQLYRKWISIKELLNHYDIFGFDIKMFIQQRICCDYEFHFDDHETKIRFSYHKLWKDLNHEILIYKYPIQYGATLELTEKLYYQIWNKVIPFSAFKDPLIIGKKHAIISYHRQKDTRIRVVDSIDDNLEFYSIGENGIDISSVSRYNKNLIDTAIKKPIDIFITVPKYMHEYPYPIVTDHLYRPYKPKTNQVFIDQYNRLRKVKTNQETHSNVYYDENGLQVEEKYWVDVLRPVVLSDVYRTPSDMNVAHDEKYRSKLMKIRDASSVAADAVEQYRMYIEKGSIEKKEFFDHLELCHQKLSSLYETYTSFLESVTKEYEEYQSIFHHEYKNALDDIRQNAIRSEWIKPRRNFQNTYWKVVSKLIYIPRRVVDLFTTLYLSEGMKNKSLLKESYHANYNRFQRPIDTTDFWTFCYDPTDHVWRPYILSCDYHYPDVYLFHDKTNDPEKIFRVLFFYSDSMNVRVEESQYQYPEADWLKDTKKFTLQPEASYHDIFIEKMYWSALHTIDSGFLYTDYRWELIEHVMENPSYERFNQLFLQSMDPYFKLSIASYFKEGNVNFPFDAAIDKIKESFQLDHLGYAKVNNYERYLHHAYKPSYYDYKFNIDDDFKFEEDNIIHRPPSSFDLRKVFYVMNEILHSLTTMSQDSVIQLKQILSQLGKENYHLNSYYFQEALNHINDLIHHVNHTNQMLSDIDVYADDIHVYLNASTYLAQFNNILKEIGLNHKIVEDDINQNNINHIKLLALTHIDYLYQRILPYTNAVFDKMVSFDTKTFMDRVNDLTTLFRFDKINDRDESLIYKINQFNDPWSIAVKRARNRLFQSTSKMYGLFDTKNPFTSQMLFDFQNILSDILSDIRNLRYECFEFWNNHHIAQDQEIISRLDDATELIPKLKLNLSTYMDQHAKLITYVEKVKKQVQELKNHYLTPADCIYLNRIVALIDLLVKNVSYINDISGIRKKEIDASVQALLEVTARWVRSIEKEKEFFQSLLSFSERFNSLFNYINSQGTVIQHICEYLNTLEIQYVPNKSLPTYQKIFQCTELEIKSPGHFYKENDIVIGKELGGYLISQTADGTAASIRQDISYYNKTFTDPRFNYNYIGTISDHHGFGLRVYPKTVKEDNIILESLLEHYLARGKMIIEYIMNSSQNINVFQNKIDDRIIKSGISIFENFDDFIKKYKENIRESSRNNLQKCYDSMMKSVQNYVKATELRKKINPVPIYRSIESLLKEHYQTNDSILLHTIEYIREINHQMYQVAANQTLQYSSEDLHTYSYGLQTHLSKLKQKDDEIQITEITANPSVLSADGGDISIQIKFNSIDYRPWNTKIDEILTQIKQMGSSLKSYDDLINQMRFKLYILLQEIKNIVLQDDIYYKINEVYISDRGNNYQYGDLITIEENGFKYVFIVTHEVDGHVFGVEPILNYALTEEIIGIRHTTNMNGNGSGCTIKLYAKKINVDDIPVMDTNYNPRPNQYQDRDLYRVIFSNIKENPNGYEVFIGGKQIREYYTKKIPMNPEKTQFADAVYLDINQLDHLKDTHIHIPEKNYYIYGIDGVHISYSGKGYFKGQTIHVHNKDHDVQLHVSELNQNVFGEIAHITLGDNHFIKSDTNPSIEGLHVIPSAMNNIDDEYHDLLRNVDYQYADNLIYNHIHSSYIGTEIPRSKKNIYKFNHIQIDKKELPPNGGNVIFDVMLDNKKEIHKYQKYERIKSVIPETDPFIPQIDTIPTIRPSIDITANSLKNHLDLPSGGGDVSYHLTISGMDYFKDIRLLTNNPYPKNEFKSIRRINLHSLNQKTIIHPKFKLNTVDQLFKNTEDANVNIGDMVSVESDKNNHYHRTIYKIDSIYINGDIIYAEPIINDYSWNKFHILWNQLEYTPHYKGIQKTFGYIDRLTKNDIGVYNWTLHRWENLFDDSLWKLDVIDDPDPSRHGFILTYLNQEKYDYSMELFIFKSADSQFRNARLPEDAIINLSYQMVDNVFIPHQDYYVNTARSVIIRKLFSYNDTKRYKNISNENHVMTYELSPMENRTGHLLLQDVKLKNLTTGQYENIFDTSKFLIRFKDEKSKDISEEINTYIEEVSIVHPGGSFNDGLVYSYNNVFDIFLVGEMSTEDGKIKSINILHTSSYPIRDGYSTLQFNIYQDDRQDTNDMGIINVTFHRRTETTSNEGFIYRVTNPFAPLPRSFDIIPLYQFTEPVDYQIMIQKPISNHQEFIWKDTVCPVIVLSNLWVNASHIYLMGKNGRLPLINPYTKEPTFRVKETENGTEITINDTVSKGSWIDIRILPYSIRSVYTLAKIPENGYLDLYGVLNKPLNKNYYEFWVNGKLLDKEVTIITPTKLFLHGLTSLINFEIVEIDRDANERLSDAYIHHDNNYVWYDFNTYLDDVLEGKLPDSYTINEQSILIYPVWPQVNPENENYKFYPPNVNIEPSVFDYVDDRKNVQGYQYKHILTKDIPSLNGVYLNQKNMRWSSFGLRRISDIDIVNMFNLTWDQEIHRNPYLHAHHVLSKYDWYGQAVILYDVNGNRLDVLTDKTYTVKSPEQITFNTKTKQTTITKS